VAKSQKITGWDPKKQRAEPGSLFDEKTPGGKYHWLPNSAIH
jgi:hypothetical protein